MPIAAVTPARHPRDAHHSGRIDAHHQGRSVTLRSASLPHALVLDVDMPILGGPGMAHKMLLHNCGEERVPIILMSGNPDLPEIAKRMGTPYFLAKPCRIDTFLKVLDRALSERLAPSSA